jgi:hypothetical protein
MEKRLGAKEAMMIDLGEKNEPHHQISLSKL